MKKRIFSVLVISVMLAFGCSKNDDNNTGDTSADQATTIAKNGSWRITYFYDTDQEETGNFSGYSFSFNDGGALVAVNGSTTVTGTWSITDSNSSDDDDSGSDDTDFNIFFSSPNEFDDLSDDWDIISISNSKIELIDVSGGNGGTDYLTFEKL